MRSIAKALAAVGDARLGGTTRAGGAMFRMTAVAAAALLLLGLSACSSTSETGSRDTLTKDVGVYPPGPSGVNHPRVGVPQFTVQGSGIFQQNDQTDGLAADQLTTLLDQTGRFRVIERAQLQQLINEQNLEGVVKSNEMAKQGQVRGVDYLVLGKVTDMSCRVSTTSNGFGVAQITGGAFNAGGFDLKNSNTKVVTECGVDIRFVDPSTGELMCSNFSEYSRTDSAGSMGIDILGASADSNANVQLSEDDKGKVLRLALDDALRKSLPKIDNFLRNQPPKPNSTVAPSPATAVSP